MNPSTEQTPVTDPNIELLNNVSYFRTSFEELRSSNLIREIKIHELSRGYNVEVGCQKFAFARADEMLLKITEYVNKPAETEKLWREGKLF